MNNSQVPPVKSIRFRARPLTTHALSWSSDTDLAIATSETIFILFPEYPRDTTTTKDTLSYQWSVRLEVAGVFHPYAAVNTQLCAFAGVKLPPLDEELGSDDDENGPPETREVTGRGASMSQVVRVEWSPSGLGVNLRPIIMAMTTHGKLFAFGEHRDPESATTTGLRDRSKRMWRILWALGLGMPIPAEDQEGSYRIMDEKITSFSWARYIAPGKALLAYKTNEEEVIIMSVHYFLAPGSTGEKTQDYVWQVREMARFEANGVHHAEDPMSADYTPRGSSFALNWSPWTTSGDSKVCSLAYISPNCVSFRRVTIDGVWETGQEPKLEVSETDNDSICLCLQPDAFLEWEDFVYEVNGSGVARGIICSPFTAHPFEIDLLNNNTVDPNTQHWIADCDTAYSQTISSNPIVDLIIHSSKSPSHMRPISFSLVRSSVTTSSQDWFETNVPQQPISTIPSWVGTFQQITHRLIPRSKAYDVPDVGSDSEDTDEEYEDVGGSGPKVHPYRFRFWGMAASPGEGTTVALISKHNTQWPSRAARSRLIFGQVTQTEGEEEERRPHLQGLTTEGKMWEWMYGNGEEVPGVTVQNIDPAISAPLRDLFRDIKDKQSCCFCESGLQDTGIESKCLNNHTFAICSASGLAILAPGISRICAVCRRRCLQESELRQIFEQHKGKDAGSLPRTDACGGCGGKFVA